MRVIGGKMAEQILARKDVWFCYRTVKQLIKEIEKLPAETFSSNAGLGKKKKMADEAFVYLDKFFDSWKDIKKDDLKLFTGIRDILEMVCGPDLPTVNGNNGPEAPM
jgi:hypothetical protein